MKVKDISYDVAKKVEVHIEKIDTGCTRRYCTRP